MKSIFTFLFLFVAVLGLNAQVAYNFSTSTSGSYTSTFEPVSGVTVYASEASKVDIDGNNKSLDGVDYTLRLKLGGTGSWTDATTPAARVIAFAVTGNSTIKLICISSNSSTPRDMVVYAGSNENTIATFDASSTQVIGSAIGSYTANYQGDATTIFVQSLSGGINFYGIEVSSLTTAIDPELAANKGELVSTEYYNLSGAKIAKPLAGTFIERKTYENGYVETNKVSLLR